MGRLIDADALEKHIADTFGYPAADILHEIATFPTVDAVPVVHGRWFEFNTMMSCSECDKDWYYTDNNCDEFRYCPNCGAKMDLEVKDAFAGSTEGTVIY